MKENTELPFSRYDLGFTTLCNTATVFWPEAVAKSGAFLDQSTAVVVITCLQPHQKKMVFLRALEHNSSAH